MNDIIKNHREFVANQIEKSFNSGISVPQELDIEKAKWKVGDEKQYQGATWVVGGFNAKGTPLWRKKKDGGSAAPAAQAAAPAGGSGSAASDSRDAVMGNQYAKKIIDSAEDYYSHNGDYYGYDSLNEYIDSGDWADHVDTRDFEDEMEAFQIVAQSLEKRLKKNVGAESRKKKDSGSPAGGSATPAAPSNKTQAPAAQSSGRVRSNSTTQTQTNKPNASSYRSPKKVFDEDFNDDLSYYLANFSLSGAPRECEGIKVGSVNSNNEIWVPILGSGENKGEWITKREVEKRAEAKRDRYGYSKLTSDFKKHFPIGDKFKDNKGREWEIVKHNLSTGQIKLVHETSDGKKKVVYFDMRSWKVMQTHPNLSTGISELDDKIKAYKP